jgi:hypothetical protein
MEENTDGIDRGMNEHEGKKGKKQENRDDRE